MSLVVKLFISRRNWGKRYEKIVISVPELNKLVTVINARPCHWFCKKRIVFFVFLSK